MFTWVCPKCGASVDVAEDACPHCGWREGSGSESVAQPSPETPPVAAQPVQAAPAQPPEHPDPPSAAPSPAPAAAPESQPAAKQAVSRRRGPLELQTKHLLIFAAAVAAAICTAVVVSIGPGDLFSSLRLEDPEEMVESPVETFAIGVRGPIEVSGIRPYYDDDFQTHVRAFVANHSKDPQSVAIQVLLRVRQAGEQAPPLATFQVVISDPLPPNGGQEVDVSLAAMGSLQSLPPWDEIRVDIEGLGASGG